MIGRRVFTLATVVVAGLWVAWSQQQRQLLTMEKVSAIFWVIVGNSGNAAVMPTSERVVLLDDKFAQEAPAIVAKVKTVSDKAVRSS